MCRVFVFFCVCRHKFSMHLGKVYVFILLVILCMHYLLFSQHINLFQPVFSRLLFVCCFDLYFLSEIFLSCLVILVICSYLRAVPHKAGKKLWSLGESCHLWASFRFTEKWSRKYRGSHMPPFAHYNLSFPYY